ncbi:MAG: rhodanese family protein [Erythrobacter sp.]|uniref:rhodanese family protein n=1 Tax=Erythrobacter sp. TaxID=1042 RepID=UPI001B1B455C|nr:rhodanese family protein [Erythrobacter sp.]MBO6767055.1 rhodanese family protein [Erythrobacter sp.]
MSLPTISPLHAKELAAKGARLIDIRGADEFARSHAAGAENRPLDALGPVTDEAPVVFLCRSGMRTSANSARLASLREGEAYCLEGGLDAWRSAGLPVEENTSAPLEIMRQVQITAGLLVLAGVILGFAVAPAWFGLSAFVGAGLTFAGATGWCGMASLLAMMPWNRSAA